MAEIRFPPDLLRLLGAGCRVTVLTGAGVSAESGVPTFRDAQTGLWAKYRPEDLASPEAFERDPVLVWDWYAWRRSLTERAAPNPGHIALAALEARVTRFTLLTQNVDSLHQRAGSRNVIELHGNISRARCSNDECPGSRSSEPVTNQRACPACGSPLRPDVVWFGEPLPAQALAQALEASRSCDLFFLIGTSAMVYPAAQLPLLAVDNGAMLVEINPAETPLTSDAACSLRGPSGVILPALLSALDSNK